MSDKSTIPGSMMAFASYKAKPGHQETLLELVKRHQPVLLANGLITERAGYVAVSADDTVIEVFEWKDHDAVRTAHAHPAVAEIWDKMTEVADFVSMRDLPESGRPFPGFAIVQP